VGTAVSDGIEVRTIKVREDRPAWKPDVPWGDRPVSPVADRRPQSTTLHANRQGILRQKARELLRVLDQADGADEPETRELLKDV
jgi:hypothetical protein